MLVHWQRYCRLTDGISARHFARAFASSSYCKDPVAVATSSRKAAIQEKIARLDAASVSPQPLVDTFGRRHNYLRISLTERCNLRCQYCMPEEGIELSPKASILSDDEVIRLATLFVKSGVTKIRLTGGEPTIRKGIVNLVARLNALREHGLSSIGMTSNGLILHRHLDDLVKNGMTHLNLSLDTLDPFKFEIMTRRMGHEAVLRSLRQALANPLLQVKLNIVVMKDVNDAEVLQFVEMTKDQPLSVRFIEFMPFTGNKWNKDKMLPSAELESRIRTFHPGLVKASDELNDTARSYTIPGYRGSLGFISSMSDHFCSSCNRLRLTADGQVKVCLFDPKEISLRDQMRSGADDTVLLKTIRHALYGKKEKHAARLSSMQPLLNKRTPRIHGYFLLPPHSTRHALSHVRYSSSSASDSTPPKKLTHIDSTGRPAMVDVSSKTSTIRTATATGRIYLPRAAYKLVSPPPDPALKAGLPRNELEKAKEKARAKGDVLLVAQLAALMASKRTADLIPLCHPIPLSHVAVTLRPEDNGNEISEERRFCISCEATVTCEGRTGVEMEALTAVSVGLLTVWDMLKAVAGKEMLIDEIFVRAKSGGKSGDFVRGNPSRTI
ncbi:molybdenum cofactor biosynthesis prote [Stereum hirsutum FP-91666 SS1]|uniref:molybdenum cofactor biosynthesis prote n=1 Tax=Stereum hirsutum (strain FP-91666) TaxID=721885 RepID=UPI000440E446|nr:molybdenum cofactor biosynthesis prote [Stereum hirsutum FP-91666 SS1]EIM92320.1 molybdenum cofactor biosynthesis prote [Stereum hirsutum FP-91666 SS1]